MPNPSSCCAFRRTTLPGLSWPTVPQPHAAGAQTLTTPGFLPQTNRAGRKEDCLTLNSGASPRVCSSKTSSLYHLQSLLSRTCPQMHELIPASHSCQAWAPMGESGSGFKPKSALSELKFELPDLLGQSVNWGRGSSSLS